MGVPNLTILANYLKKLQERETQLEARVKALEMQKKNVKEPECTWLFDEFVHFPMSVLTVDEENRKCTGVILKPSTDGNTLIADTDLSTITAILPEPTRIPVVGDSVLAIFTGNYGDEYGAQYAVFDKDTAITDPGTPTTEIFTLTVIGTPDTVVPCDTIDFDKDYFTVTGAGNTANVSLHSAAGLRYVKAQSNWVKATPYTVSVKFCSDIEGAGENGDAFTCYLRADGGQHPNVIAGNVLIASRTPDGKYWADSWDGKIGDVQLFTGAAVDIKQGWGRMDGIENSEDNGGSGIAMYDAREASDYYGHSYTAFGNTVDTACSDTEYGAFEHNHGIGSGSLIANNQTSDEGEHNHFGSTVVGSSANTGGAISVITSVSTSGAHVHTVVGTIGQVSSAKWGSIHNADEVAWAPSISDHTAENLNHTHTALESQRVEVQPATGTNTWVIAYPFTIPDGNPGTETHVFEQDQQTSAGNIQQHHHDITETTFSDTGSSGDHSHTIYQSNHTHDLSSMVFTLNISTELDHHHFVYLDPEEHTPRHKLLHYIERLDNSEPQV